jgi:hypothetical protein
MLTHAQVNPGDDPISTSQDMQSRLSEPVAARILPVGEWDGRKAAKTYGALRHVCHSEDGSRESG